MYNIPNDDYKSFRIDMFVRFYSKRKNQNDRDEDNLLHFCQGNDNESKIWASFLYSTCYSVTTSALLLRIFPSIKDATIDKLTEFWNTYKDRLIFQSDRRWVKQNDKFVSIVSSYKNKIGNCSQYEVIMSLINQSQTALYNWFTSIYYCGRFSALLFMESVYNFLGLDLTPEAYLDWNSCKTCAQSIFVISYRDDLAYEIRKQGRNLTKSEIKELEYLLQQIIIYTENKLGYKTNFARIVGYLCSYFKLYKQIRYLEYYTDRRLQELNTYKKVLPEFDYIWNQLFEIRYKNVPHEILGELNGWKGIRKEKYKEFVTYGTF
nr:MAG TPA: hypothetical protein [Caudoviricetes sp.]